MRHGYLVMGERVGNAFSDDKKEIVRVYLLYYLVVINIITFLVYGIDKLKAKKGRWRIPETTLLLLAVIGGSIGAWGGVKVWHHKTMHKKFKYGIPLIILIQVALSLYLITRLFVNSQKSGAVCVITVSISYCFLMIVSISSSYIGNSSIQ